MVPLTPRTIWHGSGTSQSALVVTKLYPRHSRLISQISITTDVYTPVVHDTQREATSHMDRLLKRRLPAA